LKEELVVTVLYM